MKRQRSTPTTFDLTTTCTDCQCKIQPNELLRIDGEHIRCPDCGKDFVPR